MAPVQRHESKESRTDTLSHRGHHHHHSVFALKWRERVRHFTWTWFTMTMATGGVANVLWSVPYRFAGLYELGCVFFILNMVLFAFNVTMISLRFKFYPSTFKASILHPTESLFIPAWLISVGIVFTNITQYGTTQDQAGEWLTSVMVVLFWCYCGLAVAFSCGIYLVMWSTQTFTISQMTPVWIFPAYPLLIIGPHAGVLANNVEGPQALYIIIGGFVFQGIGFLVSLMIYAAFLYRLMTQKLPKESLRPGMFISVGPSGFTIAGIINMGQRLPDVVTADFMGDGEFAGKVSKVMANWMGLWLWGLAFWFFIVSVGAHWSCVRHGRMTFAMTWYSYIFPNTALTTSTFAVARALDSRAIRILGCVMTCLLILGWMLVFMMMIRAVIVKDILWPQKQEDRDEGGWKTEAEQKQTRDEEVPAGEGYPGQIDVEPVANTTVPNVGGVTIVDRSITDPNQMISKPAARNSDRPFTRRRAASDMV
ncbi:hypothetical protein MBLNU230_g4216t1 [Neophaeotheca triangularis]